MSAGRPHLLRSAGGLLDLADPALHEPLAAVFEQGLGFRFIARGASMHPFIRDGDVVTAAPLHGRPPRVGQVVVFRGGGGRLVVHRLVRQESGSGVDRCIETRGDNCSRGDRSVAFGDVLGVVKSVERAGRSLRLGVGPEGAVLADLSHYGALQPLFRCTRALCPPMGVCGAA